MEYEEVEEAAAGGYRVGGRGREGEGRREREQDLFVFMTGVCCFFGKLRGCVKQGVNDVLGFGGDFFVRTWRERPRQAFDYYLWLRRNLLAVLLVGVGGVVTWESSVHALRINANETIVFPLYLPAAFALSLACIWKSSVVSGNLVGLYLCRLYMLWRGHASFDTWSVVFLFLASVLGTLEAQTCGYYVRKFLCRGNGKSIPSIDTVPEALWYICIVVVVSLLFNFVIALCITLTPLTPWSSFWRFWSTWWLGVLAAMITVSPSVTHLIAWQCQPSFKKPWKLTECFVLILICIGLLLLIFLFTIQTFVRPLPYFFFPLIMYMGFRFNRVGWALTVSSITYVCSWSSIRRRGSIYTMTGRPYPAASQLILQIELFNTVIGIVGITLAAAVREKKQLTRKLHQMNVNLEHTIDQRTAELRKANEESQISQRKAEQASHAKSDFLANMSHEIRTPIHGILGLTALLLESELSEDQKESLISVKECADLLLHIINSVLDLAKIEAGRLEVESVPFNIGKLVSSTLRMLQARAQERGLQLLWEVDIGVPQVLVGDVGKIQQCLLNLESSAKRVGLGSELLIKSVFGLRDVAAVGNALKFTHKGSVTVRVTVVTDQREISSFGASTDTSVDAEVVNKEGTTEVANMAPKPSGPESSPDSLLIKFEVQDTGIGISKEKLQDMFKPFTQADASTSRLYGGTGLGLHIVERFVDLLGGNIWAESEAGKGSTFFFCVPFLLTTSKDSPPRANKDKMHRQSWSLMGGLIFAPPLDSGPIKLSTQNSGNHKEVPSYNSTLPHANNSRDCHGEPVVDSPIPTEHCSYLTGDHCVSEEDNHDGSAQKPDLLSIGIDRLIDQEKVYSRSSPMCEASGDPIINTALQKPLTSLHERYSNGRDTQESSVFWNPPHICPYSTLNKDPSLNNGDASIEICNSESEHLPRAIDAEKTNSKPQEPSHLHTQSARLSDMNMKGIGELTLPIGDSSDSSQQQHRSIPGKVASYQSIRADIGSVKAGSEMFVPGAPSEASRMRPVSEVGAKDDLGQAGSNSIKLNGYKDGKLTILLAEDNEINQKVASRQLQKHGHLVKIVSDGQQALDVVRSQHDVLDLVLMDVQMPNMDGLQATQLIRQEEMERGWNRIPILGLTAHAIDGYQVTCISHGMDGYLGKPFDIKQLLKTMDHILSPNRSRLQRTE